jgi:hypothetical protein
MGYPYHKHVAGLFPTLAESLRASPALGAPPGRAPNKARDEKAMNAKHQPKPGALRAEETAMTANHSTLMNALRADATDAAWRTAASQFVKLAREPLVGLLTRHLAPGDDAMRAKLAAFLTTELGGALLSVTLSAALSALPESTGPAPARLARELRVRALADAGDVLADVVMGPLRQVLALSVHGFGPLGEAEGPAGALGEGVRQHEGNAPREVQPARTERDARA